jgi:hypothetical protein
MVASSNQRETVMDIQKFELPDDELSCEELDRVSGGVKLGGIMGGGGPMGYLNQIMQQVQQQQPPD